MGYSHKVKVNANSVTFFLSLSLLSVDIKINLLETDNSYNFFEANKEKDDINTCDWCIVVGNEKRIIRDYLNR